MSALWTWPIRVGTIGRCRALWCFSHNPIGLWRPGERRLARLLVLLCLAPMLSLPLAACASATPVVIEKEVIREVPVDREVIVEKEVIREVPVEKLEVVEQTVEVIVTATPTPEKTYELVWMCRTSPQENKWEREVVKPNFEARFPNITLKILILDQDDIAVKREAMITAGESLHVWSPNWGSDGFASDYQRGLIEDLTPLIRRDNFDLGDFIPEMLAVYRQEGRQWAIPLTSRGSYLYYNEKLFDEAGVEYPPTDWDDTSWTWDAMVEKAKQLTMHYGDLTEAQYGVIYRPSDGGGMEMIGLVWGKDVWPVEAFKTGFASEIYATDPAVVKGYQAIHDLIYEERVMPDASSDDALWSLGGAFQSGRTAMEITGEGGHGEYVELMEQFCWGVAAVPYGDPTWKGPRTTIYTDAWVITAGLPQEEREIAWTFIKYLASTEASRAYMEATGAPPVRRSLLLDYFKRYQPCMTPEEAEESFMGAYKYGLESSSHLIVRWDEIAQEWSNSLDAFWVSPQMAAEEAMQELDTNVEQTLRRIKAEEER